MAATVMYHSSALAGAPQLTNAWGSLVALLDACLVNGYGVKTINTLTSTAAGVATATINAGHTFVVGQVVQVAGASQSNYNGKWRVTAVTSTTLTYQMDVPGTVRTATTTSSMTAKTPGCGWTKPYSGTNRGVYKGEAGSTGNLLRVDNYQWSGYGATWAKWAAVGIASAMSSVSNITGIQAPYDSSNPNKNWSGGSGGDWGWAKWVYARVGGWLDAGDGGSGNRDWILIGNGRMFYLWAAVAPPTQFNGFGGYAFGDINTYCVAGDATGTVLCASEASYEEWPGYGGGSIVNTATAGHWLLRGYAQTGLPVKWNIISPLPLAEGMISGYGPMQYPHGPDNGIWTLPMDIAEEGGKNVRGRLPGVYWLPQYKPLAPGTRFTRMISGTQRELIIVAVQHSADAMGPQVAVDLTGPW